MKPKPVIVTGTFDAESMTEEQKLAIAEMIRLATEQIQNGGFSEDEDDDE